jgi:hypothetical protein
MASVPPLKRDQRPRAANTITSYKNTCGAIAPKTTLKRPSGSTMMQFFNPQTKSRSIPEGGTIVYTSSGPRLTPGSVSDIITFHLLAKEII